ncbi:Inner membrane amino-acid ABC transporter permease protein yecS [Escherichia coli]|nr:Inner membrane amino-acid ABC transporter permease protein yecS [Escherichia coli]
MIGLSLNTAAYAAETLRAAISSIDKGQWEAAASIGMTGRLIFRRWWSHRAVPELTPDWLLGWNT